MSSAAPESTYEYDVALSFASEQRWYVDVVARALQDWGVSVFYDQTETTNLWGKDGIETFADVYGKKAFRVVMFISEPYVEKGWTTVERRATLGRLLTDPNGNHILPVRFDDVEVPGLPVQQIFQRAAETGPLEIAELIVRVLVDAGRLPATTTTVIGEQRKRAQLVRFTSLASEDSGHWTVNYTIYNGTDSVLDAVLVAVTDPGQDSDPDIQSGCTLEVVHGAIGAGDTVTASETVEFSVEPAFVELPYMCHLLWTDIDGNHWGVSGSDLRRRVSRARTC